MFSIPPQYPAATVYRSAAIAFPALLSLPAPCHTHLRRYLYPVFYGHNNTLCTKHCQHLIANNSQYFLKLFSFLSLLCVRVSQRMMI